MADASDAHKLVSKESKQILLVLGTLFLYSVAMFTIPFVVFFGVRHLLTKNYPEDIFLVNAWSVGASVVAVNIIIASYVYKAYHEKEYDADGNEIDQHAYPPVLPSLAPSEKKSTLNLKQD